MLKEDFKTRIRQKIQEIIRPEEWANYDPEKEMDKPGRERFDKSVLGKPSVPEKSAGSSLSTIIGQQITAIQAGKDEFKKVFQDTLPSHILDVMPVSNSSYVIYESTSEVAGRRLFSFFFYRRVQYKYTPWTHPKNKILLCAVSDENESPKVVFVALVGSPQAGICRRRYVELRSSL